MRTRGNQFLKNALTNPNPLRSHSRSLGATNHPPSPTSSSAPPRTYEVVVAATRDMGIGKQGNLPWNLPSDLKLFKQITTTTSEPSKRNAVIMGRKTWESLPLQFRPLPARLNVVLTRTCPSLTRHDSDSVDVLVYGSIGSALESLALPPYSQSIERVFVIGGGQILGETLNGPLCDAIHITEIQTSFHCDTFIPAIDLSLFRLWRSSKTMEENDVRFRFSTYVRSDSDKLGVEESFELLPKAIFEKHDEHS